MDDAVMEVEQVEIPSGDGGEQQPEVQQPEQQQEDPYSSKSSREYSQWLKGLRDSGDPTAAKFARLAKDNHGSMYALKQMFPNGIDGVRESKALLDSVIHQTPDGQELRGAEAIAALQDRAREYAEIDEKVAAGDPTALETFDDAMKAGVVKMAPAILNMAKDMDPEGYAAAVLPHFVEALGKSDLVQSFNGLVDVLNEQPPQWLTPDQKVSWGKDQMQKVVNLASKMGGWLNAQAEKAGKLPGKDGVPRGTNGKTDPLSEREAKFTQREQDHHWNTNINPKLDEYAGQSFSKLFAPYSKRLNLDPPTANSLKMEFSKRVAKEAAKDKAYIGQIGRYRSMRNPDPATVLNFTKVQFDKHAKTVMDALVNERYKPFLNSKPRVAATNGTAATAPAKGVQMVTVRPKDSDIDHRIRTLDQIHKKIFPLKNGKVVQLQA
jgi:hypothetical protein